MRNSSKAAQNIFEYVITSVEEREYTKERIASDRLERFWKDFVGKLPIEFQKEAREKGFRLTSHNRFPENKERGFYYNLMFAIPNASMKLRQCIDQMDENIIICMKDPI